MKTVLLIAILSVALSIVISGCAVSETEEKQAIKIDGDKTSCNTNADCICDGIDKATGTCYLGNKDYYEKNVDKDRNCADFCNGIAGNLIIVCLDNRCVQQFECLTNEECSAGKTCVNNRCV